MTNEEKERYQRELKIFHDIRNGRMLDTYQVSQLIGKHEDTIFRKMKAGKFPQSHQWGEKCKHYWYRADVENWLKQQ